MAIDGQIQNCCHHECRTSTEVNECSRWKEKVRAVYRCYVTMGSDKFQPQHCQNHPSDYQFWWNYPTQLPLFLSNLTKPSGWQRTAVSTEQHL